MSSKKKVVLLGATGSIGTSTLKVIRTHSDKLELIGIAAHSSAIQLSEIAHEFNVPNVCLFDESAANSLELQPHQKSFLGENGLLEIATLSEADIVLVAVVGVAALKPTIAALEAGIDIAIANKEILVMGGQFVTDAAKKSNASLIPTDSEHSAIFQCLNNPSEVEKVILTASGGPFRKFPLEQMETIQPEQALKHPNWSMGSKITIDSATMANKGLEMIEAQWLFNLKPEQIDVVIHPQSIAHSFVQYIDGSVLGQFSPPLMTFAIQYALFYPEREKYVDAPLDFSQQMNLEFAAPDLIKFPCLQLAHNVMQIGGTAPAIFNAANEIAVEYFLKKEISFTQIPLLIEKTLNKISPTQVNNIEALIQVDLDSRTYAHEIAPSIS